jgi:uncharacterized protein
MEKTFKIVGMHCNSCENRIEEVLTNKEGIEKVKASYTKEEAIVEFNENKISEKEIKEIIKKEGYECEDNNKEETNSSKKSSADKMGWIVMISSIVLLFFIIYYFFVRGLDIQIPGLGEQTSLILLFFAGILTGFHCIAMCGGFVVSYTAKNAIQGHKSYIQHFIYGGSKVLSYAIIGGIFGLVGGIIAFSVGARGWIAIFAGVFMIFYSLNMFGLKWFRKFQINPKFLSKTISGASKSAKGPYRAPLITGLLSGLFIACGPLQAMYLYAMGSGSFFNGFVSLAVFGLGTLPIMIGFGSFATVISHKATKRILKISAILVLILGIVMLNRGLTVIGSEFTYDALKESIIKPETGSVIIQNGYQEIYMEVTRTGWNPNSFALTKGIPVKWNIDVKELTGCNNQIIVQDYNLDFKLKKGLNTIEFTPDKTGTVRWSCWMGMIPGSFIITEDGSTTKQELANSAPQGEGGCTAGSNCGSSTCGAATGTGGCGCGS